jgi:hypothetical protein
MLAVAATALGVYLVPATVVAAAPEKPSLTGSGSGFFITPDGFFVTSYHVVKGADAVRIRVGEAIEDAEVVTADPTNDIVVLKVQGEFSCLPMGLSDDLQLGDDVFTIGFPAPNLQGVAPKLTKGNISAASGLEDDPRFFQVSIPIQPGNSGGPLVDDRGNVVGIVTATLAPDVAMSEGFIPQVVNYAVKTKYATPLVEGIPQISDKMPAPEKTGTKTSAQIRELTTKSVGLVLVYTSKKPKSLGGKPNSELPKNIAQRPSPTPTRDDEVSGSGLTRYTNTQYQFSALVPTNVFVRKQLSPANDRAVFSSSDGRAKLELFAQKRSTRTFSQIFQDYAAEHTRKYPDKVVDYKIERDNWFVVSGHNGSRKFYVKTVLRSDSILYMYLEYDEANPPVTGETLSTMTSQFDGG